MKTKQNTLISSTNVNKTKYIDILHKRKQNKIHRYPTKSKQNTLISYISVNKTKYIDILHKRIQNKIHRYPP